MKSMTAQQWADQAIAEHRADQRREHIRAYQDLPAVWSVRQYNWHLCTAAGVTLRTTMALSLQRSHAHSQPALNSGTLPTCSC
jgi:hypothetical protein